MALKGVKPQAIKSRLKVFIYGAAKVGKSTAAIQFPKPYWIDTEACADKKKYAELIEKEDGLVFQTQDFDEVVNEVKELLTTKHEYKTLVLDSLTILYNDLLEKSAKTLKNASKEKDATGEEFGRHYGEANKRMKRLLNLLLRLDMNVIITSHSKNEYSDNMKVIGSTFDCYKKLDYLFDLILEVQKRGKNRVAIVKGSRLENFNQDDSFDFSYAEIAERYGREVLERESISEELATSDQTHELMRLIDLLKVPQETWEKWLSKANSDRFDEMNKSSIQKCIDYLKSKIDG